MKKDKINCIHCNKPMFVWIEGGEITTIQEMTEEEEYEL